jgi:hypothetical protein
VTAVSFHPGEFHSISAENEDPWPAVTFSMFNGGIVGVVMGAFMALYYAVLGSFAAVGTAHGAHHGRNPAEDPATAALAILTGLGVFSAFVAPIFYIIQGFLNPWIFGGIYHLGLSIVGGAKRGYGTTVRVIGYSTAPSVWSFIPVVGWIGAVILGLVAMVVGLDKTHTCGTGKAVLALLLPGLVLGACLCVCAMGIGGLSSYLSHVR